MSNNAVHPLGESALHSGKGSSSEQVHSATKGIHHGHEGFGRGNAVVRESRSRWERTVDFWLGRKAKVVEASRFAFFNKADKNATYGYVGNSVMTSKYTVYNFLFKFSLEAFSKFANLYFLIVSCLQMIKPISITNGIPYNIGPLLLVLFVEGLALIIEDNQRKKDDRMANSTMCEVLLKSGSFGKKLWADLVVGDIVRIKNRESVPADVLILQSTNEPAICYVETKSLDGETNLKLRQGIASLNEALRKNQTDPSTMGNALVKLEGSVEYQLPDAHIDSFHGYLSAKLDGEMIESSLVSDNVLLRGCILRNTDYMVGFVLNTGHDTKIMMSAKQTEGKLSELDIQINRYVLLFVIVELLVCVISAGLSISWRANNEDSFYLEGVFTAEGSLEFIKRVLTFFLLIANLIPIALYVAMKFARFFQAQLMMHDKSMTYYPETSQEKKNGCASPLESNCNKDKGHEAQEKIQFRVKTMDMNDSLGQIDYLFTDKTGTLTTNVMQFRKCSVDGSSFGMGCTSIGIKSLRRKGKHEEAEKKLKENEIYEQHRNTSKEQIRFIDNPDCSVFDGLHGKNGQERQLALSNFFTILSLCHEVLLEQVRDENGMQTGSVRLSAASPDDQALVTAAMHFGIEFRGKCTNGKLIKIAYRDGVGSEESEREETFELLETLGFTSNRRRMSVIVRNLETDELKLYCKGADDVIFKRLEALHGGNKSDAGKANKREMTRRHLDMFSEEGLRTLAVSERTLTKEQYSEFKARFEAASQDIEEMEKRKQRLPNAIDEAMDEIEQDMTLVGATAIEDKLQDEVPKTIALLSEAGIKIWMVTGDRMETALNIAYACNLFDEDDEKVIVMSGEELTSPEKVSAFLNYHMEAFERKTYRAERSVAVVEGTVLHHVLCSAKNTVKFVKFTSSCRTIVACRISPLQKATLVSIVKEHAATKANGNIKTLAIGDGANDIPMIQTADIGVGIAGQEGLQAANSADYSFGQFRFLQRLILVHGRDNYRRMTKLVLFMFYKNIMLTVAQFVFSFFCGWSGEKFYLEAGLQLFNLVFTGAPSFLLAVLDRDLPEQLCIQFPTLYHLGVKNQLFSIKVFFSWILNGIFHGVVITLLCVQLWPSAYHDLWSMGCLVLTEVILISNLKIFFEQSMWRPINHAGWWFTQSLWPLMATVLELPMWIGVGDWGYQWLYIFRTTMSMPATWAVIFITLVITLSREFYWKGWKRFFLPETYHILQEAVAFGRHHQVIDC